MRKMDTEFWRVRLDIKYVPIKSRPYTEKDCDNAIHSGFCMYVGDEDEVCRLCNDTLKIRTYLPYPEKPEVDPEFIKHMRKAYLEYIGEI
jgi:hypothetical protein